MHSIISIDEIDYTCELSDIEINERIEENLVCESGYGFSYDQDYMPQINEKMDVTDNEWFLEMLHTMKVSERKNSINQEPCDEIKVPVVKS